MFRLLVFLAFVLCGAAVNAQMPRPDCYAEPLGSGTKTTKVEHLNGDGWYHFCVTPFGVRTVVTAKLHTYRLIIPDLPNGTPMQELLDAAWDANVTRACDREGTDARIGAICKATWAAADADRNKPVLKSWRVATNTRSTTTPPTRPMWNGTGEKAVAERALVGELCDCSKQVKKTDQTLCPLSPFIGPGASLPDLPPPDLAAWLDKRSLTACELK